MKTKFILSILILSSLALKGQADQYMPVGTKLWYQSYEVGFAVMEGYGYHQYEVLKDTLINDTLSKIVGLKNCPAYKDANPYRPIPNIPTECTTSVGFYLRNNGSKIEYKSPTDTLWYTYFDNDWKVDSTYHVLFRKIFQLFEDTTLCIKVVGKGVTTINGHYFDYTDVKIITDQYYYIYTDSVARYIHTFGFAKDYFPLIAYRSIHIDGWAYESLSCIERNDTLISLLGQPCDTIIARTVSAVHSADEGIERLKIYPNPATGFVNLLLPDSQIRIGTIELSDFTGNKYSISAKQTEQNNYKIGLPEIPASIYFLAIKYYADKSQFVQHIKITINE